MDANPEEGRLNEEQEIEQISTYLNFYRTNVCFLPKVIPEDIVYDEEYLKKICGAQLFPNLADARDSKEKLFRIANALSLPIGGIEQLLITQFIIKKGEDYQKISELLHSVHQYTHQSIIQPLITPTLRSASGQGKRPRRKPRVPDAPKIKHDKMKQFYVVDMGRKMW